MSSVSVVIPCFDLGEYVTEAVDSVRRQTRPPEELVVVDDGSTDEHTIEVLNELRAEGVVVYRTTNRGAPRARNYGIEHSRGEHVLCLDADDVLLPRFLERTVPMLDASPEAGIVGSQVEMFGKVNGLWCPPAYSPTTLLWKNCLPSASLFRRRCWEQVGGYASQLEACHDWDLWLSIVSRGWRWEVVEEPLYRYRRRDGSISDHREANRPRILAELMGRHREAYASHGIGAVIELDGELTETRERLERYKQDSAVLRERVEALERAARPPADEQVAPFVDLVRAHVPAGATALVVSKGDSELLELGADRGARHFPARTGGEWLGHHPRGDEMALAMLEEARDAGGEFICFPRKERWWLNRYDGFRRALEQAYPVLAREEDGVIFDLRDEIPRRSFSVVMSTYKRPELVAKAMRSVFDQRYPRDRFELIVVNNDSPDDSERVVREAALDCPVDFTYLVEKRNGLSYCRNLGIAHAKHDYIALLDDDALACPDWLAAMNAVIDERKAMVVGGRVEKAFDEGFEPPPWFEYQYVKHFFGVNYRDRGRREKVFRVRFPLYLTGANLIYKRNLFDHFGGFDEELGRDGKSLLAGEEAYMNMVLDRHDVPLYYSDDAWVAHHIQSWRITKPHLRRKAWWSGVTNAVIHPRFLGFPEVRKRARESRKEIKRRLREIQTEPWSAENFSRELRLIYNVSFLWHFHLRSLGHRFGLHRFKPDPVSWGAEQRLEEVHAWRDGRDKDESLRTLALETGDDELAREATRRLEADPAPSRPRPAVREVTRAEYEELAARVCARITAQVPPAARVAVVSKGDEKLLRLNGRRGGHFPQLEDGTYAGHYPASAADAIEQLERLRLNGTTHLVFPATSLWWLNHYSALSEHLDGRHERLWDEPDTCVIYRLAADRNGGE